MSAPSTARPSAIALPIPRPPPVTSATRPSCVMSLIPSSLRLLVGEHGRALLREGLHRLYEIAGEARQHLGAVLEIDAGLEAADLELAPHDFLRHPDAERAVPDDELGGLAGRLDRASRVDDPGDQSDAIRLRGVD